MALRDVNLRAASRFDHYLDGLGLDEEASREIDPALARTVEQLRRASLSEAGGSIPPYVATRNVESLTRSRMSTRTIDRRRWMARPLSAVAAMLMVAMLLGGLLVTFEQQPGSVATEQTSWLYLAEGSPSQLVELDPISLAVTGNVIRGDDPEFSSDAMANSRIWLLSADGSTLVEIERRGYPSGYPPPTVYYVFDTSSGQLRSRIESATDGGAMIAADGRYLVLDTMLGVQIYSGQGGSFDDGLPDWIVYDTFTGQVVSQIQTPERAPTLELQGTLSADGRSLLYLSVPEHPDQLPPWPVTLIRFDLATGAEVERLALPEVKAGLWWTGLVAQTPDGCYTDMAGNALESQEERLDASLSPALAVDPTGRQVAIVHANENKVTLVDLNTFSVRGRIPFEPVGAASSTIEAVCSHSTERIREATFSADGNALFITGLDRVHEDGDRAEFMEFGIQRLELATHDVTSIGAELAPDVSVHHRIATPVDDTLTVLSITYQEHRPYAEPIWTASLQRYDATTLDLLTEREPAPGTMILISPIELTPIGDVATPEPLPQGAVTLTVAAVAGDVASVQVVADGVVQFHGPLYQGGATQPTSGDHIVVTSSNPGHTVIKRDDQPDMLMREMRQEYP